MSSIPTSTQDSAPTPPQAEAQSSSQTQTKSSQWQRPPPNSPAWLRIPAVDLTRAKEFYISVFGWEFILLPPGAGSPNLLPFRIPGSPVMGGLMQMSSMCESNLATGDSLEDGMRKGHDSNGITIHILVEDVGQTLEKAAKAGGKVTREMWVEGGHTELGEFMDSEGNAVGILRWLI